MSVSKSVSFNGDSLLEHPAFVAQVVDQKGDVGAHSVIGRSGIAVADSITDALMVVKNEFQVSGVKIKLF